MEVTKQPSKISSNDLDGIKAAIENGIRTLSQVETPLITNMKMYLFGLCSHNPSKRTGYAIVLSSLIRTFKDRLNEDETMNFLMSFNFLNKQKKKASIRTCLIGKSLALVAFIKEGIIKKDEYVLSLFQTIMEIGNSHPFLLPFVCAELAELQVVTGHKYLAEVREMIPPKLDSFIFWFMVSKTCPKELRENVPPAFREKPYNETTAENLQKTAVSTKQPWNSMVWKHIITDASADDLLVFWPQVFQKQIRSGDHTIKMSIVHIVKSLLTTLKPEIFSIVVSPSFIKMINSLLANPMIEVSINDFFRYVISICTPERREIIINHFFYADYRLGEGFQFHTGLFDKCETIELRKYYDMIKNFSEHNLIDFKLRVSSSKNNDKSISNFKLDVLRALFVSSRLHNDKKLTIELFDYITTNWENLYNFGKDLIIYDEQRISEAATFQDLLKNPELSHFDCCFKLCSICCKVSSSPSLDRLIPPDLDNSKPSTDFILITAQKVNESPLIKYAYQVNLKRIIPLIPINDLEKFFSEYEPLPETFSQSTIEIFELIFNSCNFTYDFFSSLFSLFCKTLNVSIPLSQSLAKLIKKLLNKEHNEFSFSDIIKSLFSSLFSISNKTLNQNERLIFKTFVKLLTSIIKASLPLSVKDSKLLQTHLDTAVADFAFKSSPHFGEEIFQSYIKLPQEASFLLFPILLKYIPNVKRVQRRIMLFNIITALLSLPKGLNVLNTKSEDLNKCILCLLNEDYIQSKDNEKRFLKSIVSINKWLQIIQKKRSVCSLINIGDMKRKLTSIQKLSKEPILTQTRQILQTIQKIEGKVHPKQRIYT